MAGCLSVTRYLSLLPGNPAHLVAYLWVGQEKIITETNT